MTRLPAQAEAFPLTLLEREALESWLTQPFFHVTGTDIKRFSAMGDRASASILTILAGKDVNDLMLRKILWAIRESLGFTSAVEPESARKPTASLFLLRALEDGEWTPEQHTSIRALIDALETGELPLNPQGH